MVELHNDTLVFSFPEVHRNAVMRIAFQRTLRIPDDDRSYPLPPGLGAFPLRHVDDFAERVPATWLAQGGVMLPMYQSEALWLHFSSEDDYPFAVKVAAGKVNAVTGGTWVRELQHDPQDYMVVPTQPWLDGYCVERGVVRQFVALPLGAGYSAEEQITGVGEYGGIQIAVYPIKREAYERQRRRWRRPFDAAMCMSLEAAPGADFDMGLAPGGQMEQEIYDDPYQFDDWHTQHSNRCFVHLSNALVWRAITGENPPTTPPTAAEYTRSGLPWFEYYAADQRALDGSAELARLKSVLQLGQEKGSVPLPENEAVDPVHRVALGRGANKHHVREGAF
jgi:hypothetical protein